MSQAKIMLAPVEVMRDMYFSRADGAQQKLIKDNLTRYEIRPAIETALTGDDAAEEMFDLTNNPGRQIEREQKYGRGRSVSVGDIVDVDGTMYACLSIGWEQIN